ncbi:MAG: tetratricopeptide repeat protein, partial [Verrucomicrobia bacterium]|nr:tetratricopeptide repeat protein [Verrucomicrobiota bacterium]
QSEAERQRLSQEADFAFRQAFALCPYNPEGMLRYAQFLMQMDRFDDALRVAETCLKMGAPDDQLRALIDDIKSRQKRMSE